MTIVIPKIEIDKLTDILLDLKEKGNNFISMSIIEEYKDNTVMIEIAPYSETDLTESFNTELL